MFFYILKYKKTIKIHKKREKTFFPLSYWGRGIAPYDQKVATPMHVRFIPFHPYDTLLQTARLPVTHTLIIFNLLSKMTDIYVTQNF